MRETSGSSLVSKSADVELGVKELHAFWRLAAMLIDQQRTEEAIAVCDRGLAIHPLDFTLMQVKALSLVSLGRREEALQSVVQQCSLDPKNPLIWDLLGDILREGGHLAEAEECGRQSCVLGPKRPEGHMSLATTLLLSGNYREGFKEYEWRRAITDKGYEAISALYPQWDGSELNGKRILLWAEQGAGDAVQFARYVRLVKNRGGLITLGVLDRLKRLMKFLPDSSNVISSFVTPTTGDRVFDVQCPLMTLPLLFGTELHSIPAPVSFAIPEDVQEKWRNRIGEQGRLKVGLVWAGNPEHKNDFNRSMKLHQMARILPVPECRFFSLNVSPGSEGVGSYPIENLAPLLTDFAETAAAILQLGLVITVDTSVAHLAGSLGVPTWVLLPFAPDWRWLCGRDDSPWYPSMRLFRQRKAGDWKGVFDSVVAELQILQRTERNRIA